MDIHGSILGSVSGNQRQLADGRARFDPPLRFAMATGKTRPYGGEDRIHISRTQQGAKRAEGAPVPRESGRPEVIEILRAYCAGLG